MNTIVEFFLNRPRLNYLLLFFLLILGVQTYKSMSKEIFPPMEMDMISVTGSYVGTSPDVLDKMAVENIEDGVSNISGISKVESSIVSGSFSVVLTIDEGFDKGEILNKVKDAVSLIRRDLPADMDEPTVSQVEHTIPLILVNISSNTLPYDTLVDTAKEFKTRLSQIKNLTNIQVYGDSDREFKISLDYEKIKAYDLEPASVVSAISSLSSIFPIGKIEQSGGKHFFISTFNGEKTAEKFLASIIKVGGKIIYIKDIASIKKQYGESKTISSFNGKRTVTVNVAKTKEGNAMVLAAKVKEMAAALGEGKPELSVGTFSDTSVYIRNRLNTVVSNILFGLIFVGFVMYMLINKRISFVVTIGIPTSFILSLIFLDLAGYSINMMSLLGALIAIGVIVDDAIIVAENIQRHLEEGWELKEAAMKGTKEMIAPVTAASLTTVFAFLPMLLLSGEMGNFIKIIPIAITVLIMASLIESFIFLPLHSKHILTAKEKEVDWSFLNNLYKKIIFRLIHRRKTTVFFFWVLVPLLIVVGIKTSKFQLFPTFDGDQMNISCKLPVDTSIEESYEIAQDLERKIITLKEKYAIDSLTTIVGFRMDAQGAGESGSNLFHIFIDLKKAKPDNFVAKYITPNLSFDYDETGREREQKSYEIEESLRVELTEYMSRYQTEEFEVKGPRAGIVKVPVEIIIESADNEKIEKAAKVLREKLESIEGTKTVGDDLKKGVEEIKLRVNGYGKSLGITEQMISGYLGSYFLGSAKGKSFDDKGLLEFVFEDKRKDRLETLKNFNITLDSGKSVSLSDVTEFVTFQNYEKISKQNGDKRRTVFSDVKTGYTPTEILKQMEETIEDLKNEYSLKIYLGGEKEKNEQLAKEMTQASVLALFLIFVTLLIMFDSFKYAAIILSVVPFSILGVFIGHTIMGLDLSMPSMIGALGLAGVVVNDGIIMLDFIRRTANVDEVLERAVLRLRPIMLTSITTLAGLSTLAFFPSGQAVILQPIAISLGFGLFWGTILNLFYVPALFSLVTHKKEKN